MRFGWIFENFGTFRTELTNWVGRNYDDIIKVLLIIIFCAFVSSIAKKFLTKLLKLTIREDLYQMKPGKPTVFARLNDVLIFGLPGNPVSVAVTHYLFVRTAILQMQSAKSSELKSGFAICSDKIKSAKERDCYLPVSLLTNKKGQLTIETLRFSGSSNFIAFSRADALVFVPQGKDLEKGAAASILFL